MNAYQYSIGTTSLESGTPQPSTGWHATGKRRDTRQHHVVLRCLYLEKVVPRILNVNT